MEESQVITYLAAVRREDQNDSNQNDVINLANDSDQASSPMKDSTTNSSVMKEVIEVSNAGHGMTVVSDAH